MGHHSGPSVRGRSSSRLRKTANGGTFVGVAEQRGFQFAASSKISVSRSGASTITSWPQGTS